jgi:hypothetical protein
MSTTEQPKWAGVFGGERKTRKKSAFGSARFGFGPVLQSCLPGMAVCVAAHRQLHSSSGIQNYWRCALCLNHTQTSSVVPGCVLD